MRTQSESCCGAPAQVQHRNVGSFSLVENPELETTVPSRWQPHSFLQAAWVSVPGA